ncbi:hypothetical protein TNIN_324521 [Trichonephila inaurata madagascariensis]|uniref:Uncharacterized protein n=1 Tax=Trichonephila inaurata madagascariensis TaxID=2747483 RepID=A0A8X6XPQ8_9ARAC|nr:hypothetical protein TNIN_324521 [Trichonephila inaurata madagascariensis]
MGHFIKRRKYQDGKRLQSIVHPSSFLRPRFSRLFFSRSPRSISSGLVSPVVARSSSVYRGPAARSRVYRSTCCQVQAVDPYKKSDINLCFLTEAEGTAAARDIPPRSSLTSLPRGYGPASRQPPANLHSGRETACDAAKEPEDFCECYVTQPVDGLVKEDSVKFKGKKKRASYDNQPQNKTNLHASCISDPQSSSFC